MKTLLQIREQLAEGEFEFSRHAFRRVIERNISSQEIREAGSKAEVIENYPDDKYSPSALLLGFTSTGRPLHFQVSYAESVLTKIITIYEPDPNEWIEHRKRQHPI
ncbi:MAG: DUF4258 domain-containing protein [Limisphaerales bacterium]